MWPQGADVRSAGRGHREKEFRCTQEEISKSELSRKGTSNFDR